MLLPSAKKTRGASETEAAGIGALDGELEDDEDEGVER